MIRSGSQGSDDPNPIGTSKIYFDAGTADIKSRNGTTTRTQPALSILCHSASQGSYTKKKKPFALTFTTDSK